MHVAYLSIGMSSALFSSLELSRRLATAGHRITYLSQAPIGSTVRAHGHDFLALKQDEDIRRRLATVPNLKSRRARIAERRRIQRDSMAGEELQRALSALKPDILLIDFEMHSAVLTTAAMGLPTVLIQTLFSLFRRTGVPPLHRHGRPAGTSGRRLKIEAQWWRLHLETRHMYWRQRIARWLRGDFWPAVFYDSVGLDELTAVARAHGYPLRSHTSRSQWLRPWIYTQLPILCCNAHEMDFPQPREMLPKNLRYVGPMVSLDRRGVSADDGPWSTFETNRDLARPLIYASLGTYWSADVSFLRRVVQVFERRPEWERVLGLGGRLSPEDLGDVPSNVLPLSFAPQGEILRQSSAAIVHGGVGTLNECVLLEVPMVVYSTGFVDQNGNAARLDALGLGLLGDTRHDDSRRLEELLDQAMSDPGLRARLKTMASRFRDYERSGSAVRWIESWATGKKIDLFESFPDSPTNNLKNSETSGARSHRHPFEGEIH